MTERLHGQRVRLADFRLNDWREIFVRSARGFHRAGLLATARGIAFSWMLALLPCLAAFLSLYGLFADVGAALEHLSILRDVLPARALALIGEEMLRIVTQGPGDLGAAFALSLLVALWSAATGVKALLRGLNLAYEQPETRGFLPLNAVAYGFTLAAFALVLLIAASLVILPLGLALFPRLESWRALETVRWPTLYVLVVLACEALYRFGPSRPLGRWRRISVGSATAAAAWLGGSAVLAWVLRTFDAFSATYGSLAAVFAVMFWAWLSASVVLAGARLNAEIERRRLELTSAAPGSA